MLNVSMAWKEIVADPANKDTSPDFTAKEKIILANNTILDITEEDIVENGLSIEDGTTEGNVFSIGAAKIEKHMLYLNNIEDKFSSHNFTGAVLYPQIGLRLPDTIEWLKKGVFTVDKSVNVNGTIAISAYDNMNKFEKPFSGVPVSFPVTAFNLLYAVCLYCGVSLATLTFMNKDFIINRKPTNELITCRQIVAWIAQLSCNYARCNVDGAMELKWYDTDVANLSDDINGGTFDSSTPYATGDNINGGDFTFSEITNYSGGTFKDMERYHHIYAMEQGAQIETDDIIITGVKVRAMGSDSDYGETVMYGTDGYVIEIKDNPLIQENTAAIIANSIGPKIVGVHFRPLSVSAAPDPCREAGDVANVSDQDGNYYFTIINNLSMTLGKNDRISCNAESTNSNNTSRPSPLTQVLEESKKYTKQNISAYDIAVKQLNSLMINALGYYPIQVKQDDGSYIDYMCDKPTLAESKIIWKKTIDAYAVSTDGGITWNVGITKDGNIIAQTLAVVGINANWIIAGELKSANGATRINLNDGTFDMGFGSLIWDGAEFAVVGKVTANRGKVGPYNIDESGLWSDAISILESDRMPYVWLNQVGENGGTVDSGDNDSGESLYQGNKLLLRGVYNGERVEIYVTGTDSATTEEPGLIKIIRTNVSDGSILSSVNISNVQGVRIRNYENGELSNKTTVLNGVEINKYSSGSLISTNYLIEGEVRLEKDGGSFSAYIDGSGNSYIDTSTGTITICGTEIGV